MKDIKEKFNFFASDEPEFYKEYYVTSKFTGRIIHPRDVIIQLAVYMGLDLKETDELLDAAGESRLYSLNMIDAAFICYLEGEHMDSENVRDEIKNQKRIFK